MFAYKIGLIHPAVAGLILSDGEVSYKPDRCKDEIKEILIDEISKTKYSSVVEWNGYNFQALKLFTRVEGEITDNEIIAEVSGLGSKKVANELEKVLDSLV